MHARSWASPSEAAPRDAAIATVGLGRDFGTTTAVRSIDLTIADGEIYGLLGANGAGKSTTVRMLVTLLRPSRGTATVAGHDVVSAADQVRLRIGVALQEAALDPTQTGRELLTLQARLYGLRGRTASRRLDEVVGLVDLGDALSARVATYSGGMARRLDLACALIHQPSVLFLDEPTTGLDPTSRARVWEEVRRLNAAGTTVLLTTQYLEEADALADRVGLIVDGRLAVQGSPGALKEAVQPHVSGRAATLDDVFLHHTAHTGRPSLPAAGSAA
ncbi:ABC transporter ATP-binding protein [Euzebya tangerina]|uniref:ABC transporter ATP-binding protein n=1 Tax=Euzebya tangerina TaxID=591198 RepID=UPI00196A6BE1|nr:ATP-binding cassette domain-containing protein [Euzebya tangerina]